MLFFNVVDSYVCYKGNWSLSKVNSIQHLLSPRYSKELNRNSLKALEAFFFLLLLFFFFLVEIWSLVSRTNIHWKSNIFIMEEWKVIILLRSFIWLPERHAWYLFYSGSHICWSWGSSLKAHCYYWDQNIGNEEKV